MTTSTRADNLVVTMRFSALEILGQPEAALGWQADLMGIIEDNLRNTSNSWIGVTAAVAPLSSPKVLSALDPHGEAEQFDPKDFIRQRGTLYLNGTKVRARRSRTVPVGADRRHRLRGAGDGLRCPGRTAGSAAVADCGRDCEPFTLARGCRWRSPTGAGSASPRWLCSNPCLRHGPAGPSMRQPRSGTQPSSRSSLVTVRTNATCGPPCRAHR